LAQWEALEERRTIEVRYRRFDAALVTATLHNINRSEEVDAISPFDFLPGFETDPETAEKEKLRKSVKHAIALVFASMGSRTADEIQAEKAKMITRMRGQGIEDPEELIREVFPTL
jgi:hypothetical protein